MTTDQTTDVLAEAKPWLVQCASCDAGLPMSCSHPAGDYRPMMARLVAEIDRLRVLAPAGFPRPVPPREDRMADARTDTAFHRLGQQAAAIIQPAASFATYLDATERDQLDARAAAAEHERDDALQDRDEARQTAKDLYGTLKTIERERNEAIEARDCARQTAAFRQGVIDRHRQELGAAGEVLAVVRDAAERIDRALATYDTTPGEEPEVDPDEDQAALEKLIATAHTDFAIANSQSERVEAIRDLLDGWYAAWPDTAVTDPHEPIAWELAALISAAEARASEPSVPSRRAQEDRARGYADAIAALRDDSRYMDWWSSTGVKPAGTVRDHLAAYLETVGPDGPDVTTPSQARP